MMVFGASPHGAFNQCESSFPPPPTEYVQNYFSSLVVKTDSRVKLLLYLCLLTFGCRVVLSDICQTTDNGEAAHVGFAAFLLRLLLVLMTMSPQQGFPNFKLCVEMKQSICSHIFCDEVSNLQKLFMQFKDQLMKFKICNNLCAMIEIFLVD